MTFLARGSGPLRPLVAFVVAITPLAACPSDPGADSGGTSSSTADATDPGGSTTTAGSSSEGSTSSVVDDTGTSTGPGDTDTETDTEGPPPELTCQSNACFSQCTQELATTDDLGQACTCTTEAVPPEWVWCELPWQQCDNDYVCILEGLRDGVVGRYAWSYVEEDVGGESVFLELLEPGRARAIVSTFDELACCGVQSTDTGQYLTVFELPAADDPYWEMCLALAPEIELFDPAPSCLRPESLRVGECSGEQLVECPPG